MSVRIETLEKIMSRTIVMPGPLETPCRVWTGPTSGEEGRGCGYPRMSLFGQTVAVHRVVYTNVHGYVPGKKQIDHKCRNRLCVADDHLEMVTHRVNQRRRDAAIKARKCHE